MAQLYGFDYSETVGISFCCNVLNLVKDVIQGIKLFMLVLVAC